MVVGWVAEQLDSEAMQPSVNLGWFLHGAFFFSCACMHGRHWEGGGGGVGGGPIEQLHSDAMQQRTASEWKGEVGWVGGTDRRICFRNTRLT